MMLGLIVRRVVVVVVALVVASLLVASDMLQMPHSLVEMVVTCVLDSVGVGIAVAELPFLLGSVRKGGYIRRIGKVKRLDRIGGKRGDSHVPMLEEDEIAEFREILSHLLYDPRRVVRSIELEDLWLYSQELEDKKECKDLLGQFILDSEGDRIKEPIWKYFLIQGLFMYSTSAPTREELKGMDQGLATLKKREVREKKNPEDGAVTGTIIGYDALSTAKDRNALVQLDTPTGKGKVSKRSYRFGDMELFEAFRALGVIGKNSSVVGLKVYILNKHCYMQKLVDGVRLPDGLLPIRNLCILYSHHAGYWRLEEGRKEKEELVAEGVVYYRSEKYGYKYQLGYITNLDEVADYKRKNIKRDPNSKKAVAKRARDGKYDPATDVEYYKDNRVTVQIDGESEPRVVWLIGGVSAAMRGLAEGLGDPRVVVIGNIAFIDERELNGSILLIPELGAWHLNRIGVFWMVKGLNLNPKTEMVGEEKMLSAPLPVIEYDLGVGEGDSTGDKQE